MRYVSLLRKTGKLSTNHSSGRPRKLTPKKRRHIGKILKHNYFTTASELKAKLEENNLVSERTLRRKLNNLRSSTKSTSSNPTSKRQFLGLGT